MRPRFLLVVFVLVAVAALAGVLLGGCGEPGSSLAQVRLDSGPITGSQQDGVWSFKGIPYAAPPVGQLRWKAPQPVTPWTQPRARRTGPQPSCRPSAGC